MGEHKNKQTEDVVGNYDILLRYAVIKLKGVAPQWRSTAHGTVPITWKCFHKAADSQFCSSLRLKELLLVTGD
jgi:hypothetical protein